MSAVDLRVCPPTAAESELARTLLTEPQRAPELVALSGDRDRAEAIFVVEVLRYVDQAVA
jgi:hypothetical protein